MVSEIIGINSSLHLGTHYHNTSEYLQAKNDEIALHLPSRSLITNEIVVKEALGCQKRHTERRPSLIGQRSSFILFHIRNSDIENEYRISKL